MVDSSDEGNEPFSSDDEEIFQAISSQIGVVLKQYMSELLLERHCGTPPLLSRLAVPAFHLSLSLCVYCNQSIMTTFFTRR